MPKVVENPNFDAKKRERKTGLRQPQLRILKVLAEATQPVAETLLGERAKVDKAWVSDALYGRIGDLLPGQEVITEITPKGLEQEAKQGYQSLLGLGYVEGTVIDSRGDWADGQLLRFWTITTKGREALRELQGQGKPK